MAAVGGSAPARALVGAANLSGNLHRASPRTRQPCHVSHDRARRRPVTRHWNIVEADAPRRLVFRDGFANADGTPNTDMPVGEARVTIEAIGDGCARMAIESIFPSADAMEQVLAMGMEEGLTEAVGQIDAILAEDTVTQR